MARAMWVAFEDLTALRADEIRALIRESYGLVFAKLTKKKQQELTMVGCKRKASLSKTSQRKRRS